MNFPRAYGFLMLGIVLALLPHVAPSWCPASGVDGSSARGLWLGLMSALQIGIAVGYFLRMAAGRFSEAMRYTPALSIDESKGIERRPVGQWKPAMAVAR